MSEVTIYFVNTEFPVNINNIEYCSKNEHELVLKLLLHVNVLNVKISSNNNEAFYEVPKIILEADTFFRTVGSQMAITFKLNGKDHLDALLVQSKKSEFDKAKVEVLTRSLKAVLSKTTTLKISEEKTEIDLPRSPRSPTVNNFTLDKVRKPVSPCKETNLDEAAKSFENLFTTISPIKPEIHANSDVDNLNVGGDVPLIYEEKDVKRLSPKDVSGSKPMQSKIENVPKEVNNFTKIAKEDTDLKGASLKDISNSKLMQPKINEIPQKENDLKSQENVSSSTPMQPKNDEVLGEINKEDKGLKGAFLEDVSFSTPTEIKISEFREVTTNSSSNNSADEVQKPPAEPKDPTECGLPSINTTQPLPNSHSLRSDSIASAGDDHESLPSEDVSLELFSLKPIGDYEAIQGSLEKTFCEENNNVESDVEVSDKPVIVVDNVDEDGTTDYCLNNVENAVQQDDKDTVQLRSLKNKTATKNPESRHSFHHGPRPKILINTTSVGNLTTESVPPLRGSVSQTSLNSGVGSVQYKYSALIIENEEDGLKKYYHIPPSLAKKGTYIQKGQKLHVYNDHIFAATHFTGHPPICCVCNLPLRRLGKQGYSCRDCKAVTHKRCHFLIPTKCPSSTLSTYTIQYGGGSEV